MPRFQLAVVIAFAFFLPSAAPLFGQMQVLARLKGEPLPLVGYRLNSWHVQKDAENLSLGARHINDYSIREASAFGEGFVQISGIEADTDPLRNATPKQRADPGAIRFRY